MADDENYQELMDFLNPQDGDIRGAIFDLFFPEKKNTRNPVHYKYKIIPLIMDILEQLYDTPAVIEANVYLFNLLESLNAIEDSTLDADLSVKYLKYLSGLIELCQGNVPLTVAGVETITERIFPALDDVFMNDRDGSRRPNPKRLNYKRLVANFKTLSVS